LDSQKPYLKLDYVKSFPTREVEEIESEWQTQLNRSIGDLEDVSCSGYLERLRFMTNHKQTISDFRQCPIPRVHEDHNVMKARV
jgi:hypothetical protein